MAIEAWAHPHPAGDPATGTGRAFLATPSLAASTVTPPRPWSWRRQAARGPGDSPGISLAAFAGEHSICIHLYKLCIENPSL